MKKCLLAIFSTLCVLGFSSCVSLPEPSEKVNNLVYGILDFRNIEKEKSENPEVIITIRNIDSGKSYDLSNNFKGEYIETNLPEGVYLVDGLLINYETEDTRWKQWWSWEKYKHYIKIQNGVTNIGIIYCRMDLIGENSDLMIGRGFDQAEEKFSELHPDSAWFDKNWYTIFE